MNVCKEKVFVLTHILILFSLVLWMFWYVSYNLSQISNLFFIILLAIYLFLYGISFYEKFKNLKISLISVSLIFLSLELFSQIGVRNHWLDKDSFRPVEKFHFNPFPEFSQAHASFDQNSGYKWNQGKATVEKFAGEELIFRNTFKGNNYGFHSSIDFTSKKSPNFKRWIVFGDSFTDGYFLNKNWVDQMNQMYKEDSIPTELYSFSINGGGMRNWYQIYQNIIRSKFEYDGVIFAVFGNDLMRDFFVLHQDAEHELYKYYIHIPNQKEVDLDLKNEVNAQLDFIPLFKGDFIYTSKICNFILREYFNKKYQFSYKNAQSDLLHKFIKSDDSLKINEEYMENKYHGNYQFLMGMIDSLKIQNKQVLLLSIPELYGLKMNVSGHSTQIQKELNCIANQQKLIFIDGYQLLISPKKKSLDSFYFKNDGHWNQAGSDEFALQLYNKNYFLFN